MFDLLRFTDALEELHLGCGGKTFDQLHGLIGLDAARQIEQLHQVFLCLLSHGHIRRA